MESAGTHYITFPSRSTEITIYNVADIHLGVKACDKKKLREDVERIKSDERAFWFGGGDYADYVSPTDKRWSAGEIDPEITVSDLSCLGRKQADMVLAELKPIANKCIGLLLGNHEAKYISSKEQSNLHAWLCTELGVPNFGYCALFDVVFSRKSSLKRPMLTRASLHGADSMTVRNLAHHGFGGAITPGGKLNTLIKAMNSFVADVYWMGHVHEQKAQRLVRIGADANCKNLTQQEQLGIITGSYLRTYHQGSCGYGETKGYSPSTLGMVGVTFAPEKRKFWSQV